VIVESIGCNVWQDRDEEVFSSQEKSALCYSPISTKLPLVLKRMEGVRSVMFELPRCNMSRDREGKLFRPQE
jgi:hypothetical protein